MIIIKCNCLLPFSERLYLESNLRMQAADGVIVLPPYCELLHCETGDDIKVVYEEAIEDAYGGN